jgi:hypothetical protein
MFSEKIEKNEVNQQKDTWYRIESDRKMVIMISLISLDTN